MLYDIEACMFLLISNKIEFQNLLQNLIFKNRAM